MSLVVHQNNLLDPSLSPIPTAQNQRPSRSFSLNVRRRNAIHPMEVVPQPNNIRLPQLNTYSSGPSTPTIERVQAFGFEQPDKRVQRPIPNITRYTTTSMNATLTPTIPLPNASTIERMRLNAIAAINDHRERDQDSRAIYALPEEAVCVTEELMSSAQNQPLVFCCSHAQYGHILDPSSKTSCEDTYLYKEIRQGILAGVFDGHHGNAVSRYIRDAFSARFEMALDRAQGDVRYAFRKFVETIQREVLEIGKIEKMQDRGKQHQWDEMGSTAVVCYIDKHTNLLYTAGVGDSKAKLYRKFGRQLKSIPLCRWFDWSVEKEAARAIAAWKQREKEALEVGEHEKANAAKEMAETIAAHWINSNEPKTLRYPFPKGGINVSRSIGDANINAANTLPAISHTPVVTINKLKAGDRLILSSDGLDTVTENEMISELQRAEMFKADPAQALMEYASSYGATDDITVVSIVVNEV